MKNKTKKTLLVIFVFVAIAMGYVVLDFLGSNIMFDIFIRDVLPYLVFPVLCLFFLVKYSKKKDEKSQKIALVCLIGLIISVMLLFYLGI